MSLCLFPAAVTLRPLPMANRCQRLLRYPPLCSSLRLVCRRARHPLPAGRLKGPVQRQWQAGPVLTVVDPVFLSRLWCACGGSLTARPPAPDQPSLARGLGRGRLSCHIALAHALSLSRPSACRRGHAYTHAHVQCSAPLHFTARCKEGQW